LRKLEPDELNGYLFAALRTDAPIALQWKRQTPLGAQLYVFIKSVADGFVYSASWPDTPPLENCWDLITSTSKRLDWPVAPGIYKNDFIYLFAKGLYAQARH
jgi:hypothetical protein